MQRPARGAHERASRLLGIAGLIAAAGLAARAVGCGGAEFQEAPGDGGVGSDAAGAADATAGDGGAGVDGGSLDAGHKDKDASTSSDDAGDAATSPAEGGMGSADSGDAGPPPFCPSSAVGAIFCSDFDTTSPPQFNWDSSPVNTNGTLGVDTADFISAPNGFAAANKGFATGNATLASLGKLLSSGMEHLDYSFELFVKKYDPLNNPEIPFAQLTIGTAGTTTAPPLTIQLILKGGNLEFSQIFTGSDGGQQSPVIALGPLATGAWVKIELLLDRSSSNWTAMVIQDGVQKIDAQIAVTPGDSNFEVDLGILEVLAPTTENALTFDNVLVRAY